MFKRSKEYLVQHEMKILGLAALAYLMYLILNVNYHWGQQWVEGGAVLLLVFVTVIYVERTGRIATHTERQVQEMQEQRIASLMPVLVVDCYQSPKVKLGKRGIEIPIENIGLGPALDVAITIVTAQAAEVELLWDNGMSHVSSICKRNIPELAASANTGHGDNWEQWELIENQGFIVVVECNNVYRNNIGAYREFKVNKNDKGDLYIRAIKTVSAKRINYRLREFTQCI